MAITAITKDFVIKSGLIVRGTASAGTSTGVLGTLQVDGGAAVHKDIVIGSTATIYGSTTIYAATTLTSTLAVGGDVAVNIDKFTVASATGNTAVKGDLAVNGTSFTVAASSGNTAILGDLAINGTKFTVAASSGNVYANGNMGVLGTFNSTGTLTVNTNKFSVDGSTGNTAVLGDFAVNTNKFTVAASSGNVYANGNMGVNGTFNSTGTLTVNSDKFSVAAATGNTAVAGTLDVTGQTTVANLNAGATTATSLNVTGTVDVTGQTTVANLSAGATTATSLNVTGNGTVGSNLGVTGTFNSTGTLTVNTNKFSVDASNGNTLVDGTLGVKSDFAVNSTSFTVAAATGNTAILGNLAVNTDKFTVASATGNTAILGNLAVNTDKFTVASATGNTAVAGTLAVTGNSTLTGTLQVNNTTSDITVGGYSSNSIYTKGGVGIEKGLLVGLDVVITGNLTVKGTQTIVDSTTTSLKDPIIDLGTGLLNAALTSDDGYNKGLALHYYAAGDKNMFVGRDSVSGHFTVKSGLTSTDGTGGAAATVDLGTLILADSAASTSTIAGNTLQLTNGGIGVKGASRFEGDITVTGGIIQGTITQANNLNGGGLGYIPIQSASGTTAFIPAATIDGSLLTWNSAGSTATWVDASLSVPNYARYSGTATNIANGLADQIPFQYRSSGTAFSSDFAFTSSTVQLAVGTTTIGGAAGAGYVSTKDITASGNVYAGGNMGVNGTFNSTGTLTVNTNKFSVDAANGNTAVAGTLDVTGQTTVANLNAGATTATSLNVTGTVDVTGQTTVANLSAGATTATSLNVTGNETVGGNLGVTGTFNSTGTLTVNTDKFTVTAASGNVYANGNMGVNGTFNSTGTLTVNSNFSVDAANGNTIVAGTLNVTGQTTVANLNAGATTATSLNVTGTVGVTGQTTVANLNAGATTATSLNVTGQSTLAATTATSLGVSGTSFFDNDVTVNADLYVEGTIFVKGASLSGVDKISGSTGTFVDIVSTGTISAVTVGISGLTHITNTTDADPKGNGTGGTGGTGSLVVDGGAYVTKNLVAGGTIFAGDKTNATTSGPIDGLYIGNNMQAANTKILATTGITTIDSWSASVYTSAKYIIQIVQAGAIHTEEVMIVQDGTDVYMSEYGVVTTGEELGTVDADITGGNVILTFTPFSATSMVVQVVRQSILTAVESYC